MRSSGSDLKKHALCDKSIAYGVAREFHVARHQTVWTSRNEPVGDMPRGIGGRRVRIGNNVPGSVLEREMAFKLTLNATVRSRAWRRSDVASQKRVVGGSTHIRARPAGAVIRKGHRQFMALKSDLN